MKEVTIYFDEALTIARAKIPPKLEYPPHNHGGWAVVGIYKGQEDNFFYKRDEEKGLLLVEKKYVKSGDVLFMDKDSIHTITNPLDDFSYGIHVYGCNMIENWKDKSSWDQETFIEIPYTKDGIKFSKN